MRDFKKDIKTILTCTGAFASLFGGISFIYEKGRDKGERQEFKRNKQYAETLDQLMTLKTQMKKDSKDSVEEIISEEEDI